MTHIDDTITVTQDPREEGGRWWASWRDPVDRLTVQKWGTTADQALVRLAADIEANPRLDPERKQALMEQVHRMVGGRL